MSSDLSVVAALDDVLRLPRNDVAGKARHDELDSVTPLIPQSQSEEVVAMDALSRFMVVCFLTGIAPGCALTASTQPSPQAAGESSPKASNPSPEVKSEQTDDFALFRATLTKVSLDRRGNATVYLRFESKAPHDVALFSVRHPVQGTICVSQLTDTSGNTWVLNNNNCSIPLSDPIVQEVPPDQIASGFKLGLRLPVGRSVSATFVFAGYGQLNVQPDTRFTFSSTLQIAFPVEGRDPGWQVERVNLVLEGTPKG